MFSKFKYETIPLKSILLDKRNPRIVTQTELGTQEAILKYLFDHEDLGSFIKKIASEGKNQGAERPYIVKAGSNYTVIEGNTRIAAYKVLTALLAPPPYLPCATRGGKATLYPFFAELIKGNSLFSAKYCEPYAGGAGLAIRLLTNGLIPRISINDIDASIYAFWQSVFHQTEKFCNLIDKTPITIDEWHRQKAIWTRGDQDNPLALGFSAYFLNRTNRSGIIEGAGPIGGYKQSGTWKIDVRFVKAKQIENLRSLARYANQIEISNLDAINYLELVLSDKKSFVYLDPPYFVKGRKLYKNFYEPDDHQKIAQYLETRRDARWIVSYDDVTEIRNIYSAFSPTTYFLNYSAGEKTLGKEVIFASDSIILPSIPGFEMAA